MKLHSKQIEERKYQKVEHLAQLCFKYEGTANDEQLVQALDKKYDALADKLLLEAMQKQMGKGTDKMFLNI